MQLTRKAMYASIEAAVRPPVKGDVLAISGLGHLAALLDPTATVTSVEYPAVDMQALPYADEVFDAVLTDQVIEHVAHPWTAVQESFRVLRPGGLAIHTTCFLNPIHYGPRDCYRFSAEGLEAICPPGVEVIEVGSWGNRIALGLILSRDRFRFLDADRWPVNRIAGWNEPKYPIVTWLVARRGTVE